MCSTPLLCASAAPTTILRSRRTTTVLVDLDQRTPARPSAVTIYIRSDPLHACKARLAKLLTKACDGIQYNEHMEGEIGVAMIEHPGSQS